MPRADQSFSGNEIQWISSQSVGKYKIMESVVDKPEKISFWNDAPPFHSSTDTDCAMDPVNKFMIEKVEVRSKSKILHGARQVAVVSGVFSESKFEVGQKVSVFPCLCCLGNSDTDTGARNGSASDPNCSSVGRGDVENDTGDGSGSMDVYENKAIFYVDDGHNVIVVEDGTLTVTSFCSARECINNPLISSMVADFSFGHTHPSLTLGIVIHEIIQTCLISKQSSFAYITKEAKRIIGTKLLLLYSCNVSEKEMLNEVLKHLKNIMKFLGAGFTINSIEHKVYSSCYGLKGCIDCLDVSSVIEIKTGKCMRVEHRYQAILYSMLMMEQHLRKGREDYNGFLWGVGSTLASGCKAVYHSGFKRFLPILYYVKSGDFFKIDIDHQEIVHLLRLRNDIACNRELSSCHCPEDHWCTILNRIKGLDSGHFLRKQLEAIEAEGKRKKTFFRGAKIEQRGERAVYGIHEKLGIGEHVCVCSTSYNMICLGVVESMEDGKITILLRESIDLDKIVMICLDNDTMFLKFMRWSLIQIAYVRYLKGDAKDRGVGSFLLPGQELGLGPVSSDSDKRGLLPDLDNPPADSSNKADFVGACSSLSSSFDVSLDEVSDIDLGTEFSSDGMPVLNDVARVGPDMDGGKKSTLDEQPTAEIESPLCESIRAREGAAPKKEPGEDTKDSTDDNVSITMECRQCLPTEKCVEDLFSSNNIEVDFSSTELDRDNSGDIADQAIASVIEVRDGVSSSSSAPLQRPRIAFNHLESTDHLQYFAPPVGASFQSHRYCIPEAFRDDFLKLNEDQKSALFLALNCESYRIIHGMPGTGKSTLISLLIRILVHYGQKVLLICYTHMAIENILKKIGDINYYRAKRESIDCRTYEELRHFMQKPDVVAGTCYSFSDPIYIGLRLDYCIIDEGSQVHLLLSLIPISLCDRFCIVGDHLQLKPLAKKSRELTLSLFEYLMEGCSVLKIQYRMGDSIMRLSNTLFYNNTLIGVGKSSTVQFIDSTCLDYPLFINSLGKCSILCYFNSQVKETARHTGNLVTTIDRFQGSEGDEIVVVFDPVERCEVMESRERLNVALTRARSILKLVGNRESMMEVPLFRQLLGILLGNQHIGK